MEKNNKNVVSAEEKIEKEKKVKKIKKKKKKKKKILKGKTLEKVKIKKTII